MAFQRNTGERGAQREKVALRLGHLLVVDVDEAVVHPPVGDARGLASASIERTLPPQEKGAEGTPTALRRVCR